MHGLIFAELKKFVDAQLGTGAWTNLLQKSGLSAKTYVAVQEYPDAEIVALVTTASQLTSIPVPDLLEAFGRFIVPDLLKSYGALLDKKWKTLDVIEHTENTIHRVVRLRNPGAKPPELVCRRPSEDEVMIHYASPRKMCSVAKGIARGVADHFSEQVEISELSCMHNGGSSCEISVRVVVP